MAPIAKSDASVSMITSFAGSKWAKIGAVVNRRFSSEKAVSASAFQDHSLSFLVSSVSGLATRE